MPSSKKTISSSLGELRHCRSVSGHGFKCDVCDKNFGRKDTLQKHKKEVHFGLGYDCPECDASYTRKYKLDQHLINHESKHKKETHFGLGYDCPECDASYTWKYKLDQHMIKHESKPTCSPRSNLKQEKRQTEELNKSSSDSRKLHSTEPSSPSTSQSGTTLQYPRETYERKQCVICKERSSHYSSKNYGIMEPVCCLACAICGEIFTGKCIQIGQRGYWSGSAPQKLDIHAKKEHPNLTCQICPISSFPVFDMENHMSAVHNEEQNLKLKCSICDSIFTRHYNLNRHVEDVHGRENHFKCPACPEQFSRLENMRRHFRKEICGSTSKFYCPYCQEEYTTHHKSDLYKHYVPISNQKGAKRRWTCVVEKEKENGRSGHERPVYLICSLCNKSFTRKNNLTRHINATHLKQNKFQCQSCREEFNRLDMLKSHLKKGQHSFKFDCQFCYTTHVAKTTIEMQSHFVNIELANDGWKKTCVTEKRKMERESQIDKARKSTKYQCSKCGKKFTKKRSRDRHIQEKHSEKEQIKCPDCERIFSRKQHLDIHRTSAHAEFEQKEHHCCICRKTFKQKENLVRHKKQVHSGYKYSCEECPASFARKEKLDIHCIEGKHHIRFYCKSCNQIMFFKSVNMLANHITAKKCVSMGETGVRITCKSKYTKQTQIYHEGGPEEVLDRFIESGLEIAENPGRK